MVQPEDAGNGGCTSRMTPGPTGPVLTFAAAQKENPDDGGSRDLTCRDDPAGRGYQMLKKAFGLTIAQSLGVS